jgi:hypothetical protein
MMLKGSQLFVLLVFLPSATAQVRGAHMRTATTKFNGFARNEIQVLAGASSSKTDRIVIFNLNS